MDKQQELDLIEKAQQGDMSAENAVALQDYLAISNASALSKESKKRNQDLQKTVTEKLKEFDKNNSLEDIKTT